MEDQQECNTRSSFYLDVDLCFLIESDLTPGSERRPRKPFLPSIRRGEEKPGRGLLSHIVEISKAILMIRSEDEL